MKIKSYKVIEAPTIDKLKEIIDDYIYNDWQPIGGVQVVLQTLGDNDVLTFYQAVVEY